ncbi:MAG: lactate utilization protein [Clostridia bacterium]|nr:lactate utilization protein [Clostridia bacterium]
MNFETVKSNLEARGFQVSCFESAREAVDYMDAAIDGTTVALGGSMTLEQIGLYERLRSHNEVLWHQKTPAGKTSKEIRDAAVTTRVYVASVNGLAETGEIINIDGTGNRVASTYYGHEKVYLVIGRNKLAPDYDSALWRARNVAAPKNAQRLGVKTPCAQRADRCYDCNSPQRICRGLSVFWQKPNSAEFEVILVGEDLGY